MPTCLTGAHQADLEAALAFADLGAQPCRGFLAEMRAPGLDLLGLDVRLSQKGEKSAVISQMLSQIVVQNNGSPMQGK